MKWKGCGRKQSWLNLKVLYRHLSGGVEKNHGNLSWQVSRACFVKHRLYLMGKSKICYILVGYRFISRGELLLIISVFMKTRGHSGPIQTTLRSSADFSVHLPYQILMKSGIGISSFRDENYGRHKI
jgi:hypothetical protein